MLTFHWLPNVTNSILSLVSHRAVSHWHLAGQGSQPVFMHRESAAVKDRKAHPCHQGPWPWTWTLTWSTANSCLGPLPPHSPVSIWLCLPSPWILFSFFYNWFWLNSHRSDSALISSSYDCFTSCGFHYLPGFSQVFSEKWENPHLSFTHNVLNIHQRCSSLKHI